MTNNSYKLSWHGRWSLLTLLTLLVAPLQAAKLAPKTLADFADYLCDKEMDIEQRIAGKEAFLWALESDERTRGLKEGEIYVKPTYGKGETDIDGGLVHDWVGTVFIPGVTL